MLASFLVAYLQEQRQDCVLYFFCKAQDAEKRQAIQVHRTLLAQLLHYDEKIYDAVESIYTRSGRVSADSMVDVCSALRLAFSETSNPRITIIIDALDECEDAEYLVRVLFEIRSQSLAVVKLIFTSRDIPLPFDFDEDMIFEANSPNQPIQRYVQDRVLHVKTLSDPALAMTVVRRVSRAADGLWLFARLMLDEIESLPSAEHVQRHLRNVPHGLTQLYTHILATRECTFTNVELKFAQQIYLWLDVSDYIPSFLSYVDCLTYNTLSCILQFVNFGQPVFDPIDLVSRLCSPLVKANDFQDEGSITTLHDFEISAIHHTANQYIRESQNHLAIDLPSVLAPRRLRQLYRGATAVWYYTDCDASREGLDSFCTRLDDGEYGSYFEMVYGLWGALRLRDLPGDLTIQETKEAARMIDEMIQFIHPETCKCLRWIESAVVINYANAWTQLWRNAEQGLALLREQIFLPDFPTLEAYRLARIVFFTDYEYVLRVTGPGNVITWTKTTYPCQTVSSHVRWLSECWKLVANGSICIGS